MKESKITKESKTKQPIGLRDEDKETIEAIRSGQVDAVVVAGENGPKLYTLKPSDQNYRLFIEKMIEGAVTLNKKGAILYGNSRFIRMLKLPAEQVLGTSFKNYVLPKQRRILDKLLSKGWKQECKAEISLVTHEDELIPVLASLTTLELDEGTSLSLVLTDLTAQKKIEQELRERNEQLKAAQVFTEQLNNELEQRVNDRTRELLTSREHFKFLANTIPVIVWTALPNGDFDYYNRQWYDYTGLTYEQSKGKGWKLVIHPDDIVNVTTAWNHSITNGSPLKVEARKKSFSGNYRWHITNALPFKDGEGKIIAWFGVCTDIEDQKRDMEKKDEFISMASHELKTPVTTLKAYTQIMMMTFEKNESSMESSMLDKMNKQIDKLTSLIGDLLDVSKANMGQLHFYFEPLDFNEIVKEVVTMMQFTSLKHSIELHLQETRIIEGDKNRLGQAIINLISNALKYSPDADRVIVSSVIESDCIRFCVQDFGIGIPLSQQSKLFSRFFRVSENTYPGLGLGLYISNEIINRHSGTFEFRSEEGAGSTFCFTLPIKSPDSSITE